MVIFVFINIKGGVGKSLISKNLAYLLSVFAEKKTLFIDNDKQGNSSKLFGANGKETIAELMLGEKSIHEVIQKTKYEKLDVISANMRLVSANLSVLANEDCRQDNILKNALSLIEDQYDFCIIDNPPDINLSVFNALSVADEVVIVTTPDKDSMDGVDEMITQINTAIKYNPDLILRGCLMNKFMSFHSCYQYKDKSEYTFFNTNIHLATRPTMNKLILARDSGVPILEYAPNCLLSRQILSFAKELLYLNK